MFPYSILDMFSYYTLSMTQCFFSNVFFYFFKLCNIAVAAYVKCRALILWYITERITSCNWRNQWE